MGKIMTLERESKLTDFRSVSDLLNEGFFEDAEKYLENSLSIDCNSEEIIAAMKSVAFWKDKFERFYSFDPQEHYQKGEYLILQWINFCHYFEEVRPMLQNELTGLRFFIFSQAAGEFRKIDSILMDADCYLHLGRCYKQLDNYEESLKFMEKSFKRRRQDALIMAELADIFSLSNREKMSKVFFREAFFIAPEKIELAFIESPIIIKMIEKISEKEYDERVLKYWIPVYGAIYGVFNIKRELKPVELGKLKQAIFVMEQQDPGDDSIRRAKLLNHYFWLIDHTKASSKGRNVEGRETVEEVLQKIKRLDRHIYLEYTK